jgi:disulfide bond formation protein DsbB
MFVILISPMLSLSVLVSNALFIIVVALFVFSKDTRQPIRKHFHKHSSLYTFFFALMSMVGSLMLSDLVGFPPCDLCWWLRVVMYPQVLIAFVALIRKETSFIYYCLPMSVIGFVISLYQSYIQWGGTTSVLPCTANGGACSKLYVDAYGYITIPFMALSAFIYLITVSLLYVYESRSEK